MQRSSHGGVVSDTSLSLYGIALKNMYHLQDLKKTITFIIAIIKMFCILVVNACMWLFQELKSTQNHKFGIKK